MTNLSKQLKIKHPNREDLVLGAATVIFTQFIIFARFILPFF